MEDIEKELKLYGLHYREGDAPYREPIDFVIEDKDDNVAWVWGYLDDIEYECNHPVVEYYDNESKGECPVCGALCDWHWVDEDDHKGREPHDWYAPMKPRGIIEKILNEEKKV